MVFFLPTPQTSSCAHRSLCSSHLGLSAEQVTLPLPISGNPPLPLPVTRGFFFFFLFFNNYQQTVLLHFIKVSAQMSPPQRDPPWPPPLIQPSYASSLSFTIFCHEMYHFLIHSYSLINCLPYWSYNSRKAMMLSVFFTPLYLQGLEETPEHNRIPIKPLN